MQAVSLNWFAAQQQTSTFGPQKCCAQFNELIVLISESNRKWPKNR